jgi:hypothetical protein
MADHFYSVLKGEGFDPATVTAGTSTSGESIELRVADGDTLANTKLNILNALRTLMAYFEKPSNTITA